MGKGRLRGKVAIITGATAGIGRGIAIQFAKEGANVIVNGRDPARAKEVMGKCMKFGKAEIVLGDVSQSGTWEEIRRTALSKFKRIDVLINNAAYLFYKSALDTTEEEWDKQAAIGLKSAWLGAKFCLPQMIKQKGGSIINISSVMSKTGGQNACGYVTTKGGMDNLTMSLAQDYGKNNIRVNTLSPGFIASRQNTSHRKDPKFLKYIMDHQLLKTMGQPDDIAMGAIYLASDESRFVTAANLFIDAGMAHSA